MQTEITTLANTRRNAADEIESRFAGLDQWAERLTERERIVEAARNALEEHYSKRNADLDAQHLERSRLLDARERQVADVRQIASDRKAALETLRQAVEGEREKRRAAEATANNLREQIVRLERTLADALARKAVES